MAHQITCNAGHLYDSDLYSSCPYCKNGVNEINFNAGGRNFGEAGGTVAPQGFGKNPGAPNAAAAPQGFGRNFGEPNGTVAPQGFGRGSLGPGENATVPPKGFMKEKDTKTVIHFQKKTGIDPVVGWLVCTKGPESLKGKDFSLKAKINTIGRGDKNDITIKYESISENEHAKIAYDHKHNNFQLLPAGSSQIFYLNDQPVYMPMPLKSYDMIEMGDIQLTFISFCNEKFQWSVQEK